MSTFNKFNNFVDGLCQGKINLASAAIKVMLTNTAPVATNTKYTDISTNELAAGNGYSTGGAAVTGTGVSNTNGVETLAVSSTTFTSNTGAMGPFRYAVYYDSTSGYLIGWYDYGQSVSLNGAAGETFQLQPGTALLTIA